MIITRESFTNRSGHDSWELGVHCDVAVGFYEGADLGEFGEEVGGPDVADFEGGAGGGFETTVGGVGGGGGWKRVEGGEGSGVVDLGLARVL